MGKRYFTVDEANALVPRLAAAFDLVLRLRAQLRATSNQLGALGEPMTEASVKKKGGPAELQAARARARGFVELITEAMQGIEALGVEVKDLDTGLCDFVAKRDGRDVYLCWKLGEPDVAHWHELSAGFAGRKPLATPGAEPREP